ncbi:hypothetical protein M5K25_012954 [Dendrobium thyrsiflorum]|uniref:Uncharacterized protein n=1 Tax=Dendrobium thyrsiflorum TaxID=117978 RepID=A0ABD0UYQ5_DENTH
MKVEENLFDDENATLADMRRQIRRQMRAKDKEISQLNEKMTEMIAQMTTMMQMMQRTAAAGTIPNPPTDPPILRMPQVSGVRGTPEGGHETHNVIRQPTPQNIASTSEPITIADLALEKRKREESVTKYITRWRNLSMKCEQQLEEEHAVQLLMGNIDDKMQPFLCMATITTFQDLLDRVAKFEKLNLSRSDGHFDKHKKIKASGARRGEADSTFFSRADKGKQVVYNVDKGKQPMQYEEKPKQVYNPNPQPKLILGGNDKPQNFQGGGERPRQNIRTGDRTFPSLKDKMNKEYSFKREITSSSVPPDDEKKDNKKPVQEEKWETAVSKKTVKMLKQLEGVPGVKWKSPTKPVLNLKGLPKVQASTSKQHLSQASFSKPGKPKFFKKKTKLKKPKEKKTVTQKVIDSLDEYYQTVRQPIKLADFMSGLKIGEIEEDGDADFLPAEVCRVISVVPSMAVSEKYVKKEASESCMMVLPMDCSSEENLYFREEDESDPDIASQMGHVNLGGDSENQSLDAVMADSEENVPSNESEPEVTAQVQLRSSKILPPPPKKGVSDKEKGKEIQVGRKKASPTLPKAAVTPKERKHVPHIGSDTDEDDVTPTKSRRVSQSKTKRRKQVEYSNDDYDYDSIYTNTVHGVVSRRIDNLSISDSVLVVTRIPLQCFREIIPRNVHDVEELTTFYVPPLRKGSGPASLFYSIGKLDEDINRYWFCNLIDSGELVPTRFPRKEDFRDYVPEQIEPEQLEVFQQPEAEGSNGCKRPDPTRPNMVGSLAAPSTQYATRKAAVEEPPLRQPVSEDCRKIRIPRPVEILRKFRKKSRNLLCFAVVSRKSGDSRPRAFLLYVVKARRQKKKKLSALLPLSVPRQALFVTSALCLQKLHNLLTIYSSTNLLLSITYPYVELHFPVPPISCSTPLPPHKPTLDLPSTHSSLAASDSTSLSPSQASNYYLASPAAKPSQIERLLKLPQTDANLSNQS